MKCRAFSLQFRINKLFTRGGILGALHLFITIQSSNMTHETYQGCLLYCQDSLNTIIWQFPLLVDIQYNKKIIKPKFILSFITMSFVIIEKSIFHIEHCFQWFGYPRRITRNKSFGFIWYEDRHNV